MQVLELAVERREGLESLTTTLLCGEPARMKVIRSRV